ncbi:MAG: hypothetical protein ACRDHD_08710 [Candidatus Limnocylindria bacterium]
MNADDRLDNVIRAALVWEAGRAEASTPPFDRAMSDLADRLEARSSRRRSPILSRRLAVLLAAALLVAALAVGAVVSGFFRVPALAAVVRADCVELPEPPTEICDETLVLVDGHGNERQAFPPAGARPVRISSPAWTLDGRRLAFVSESAVAATPADPLGAGRRGVYVIDQRGGPARMVHVLDEDEGVCNLSWAPDGGSIAVCVSPWRGDADRLQTSLRVVDVETGEVTILADDSDSVRPAWSPDGAWILYRSGAERQADGVRATSGWIVRADGTERRHIVELDPEGFGEQPMAWTPDSQAVAVEGRSTRREATIEIIRLDGGRSTVTPRPEGSDTGSYLDFSVISWSSNGEVALAARGFDGFELVIGSPLGASRSVASTTDSGIAFIEIGGLGWSADGRHLTWWEPHPPSLGMCVVTFSASEEATDRHCIADTYGLAVVGTPGGL